MDLITAKKVFKEQALGWFVERKLKLWVYFFLARLEPTL
jgi:hypothetical protein